MYAEETVDSGNTWKHESSIPYSMYLNTSYTCVFKHSSTLLLYSKHIHTTLALFLNILLLPVFFSNSQRKRKTGSWDKKMEKETGSARC